MAEIGVLSGLAQNLGFDQQINDLRYHELENRRALAENEAKVSLFAQDLDYQNAANSYDAPQIKEYAKNKINEIGKFVRENPDWQYNVDKRLQLNALKKDLKNNELITRGLASDTAYKSYLTDLQEVSKNPNSHNIKAYDNVKNQWNNYLQYGNQNGLEAAQKEGKKAFIYQKPQDFTDIGKKGVELGNNFKDLKLVDLKNGRSGAWITEPKEDSLNKLADGFYQEHKEQFDQQHPENPLQAAKEYIKAGIKQDFNYGDNHYAEQLSLMKKQHELNLDTLYEKNKAAEAKGGKGFDYYVETIIKPPKTVDTPERLKLTFGSTPKHFITSDDGKIKIDNTGDNFHYNGDIEDVGYREDGKYNKTGKKVVSGYVYKPLSWAKEKGIIIDAKGFSGIPELDGTDYDDYEVDGNWGRKASIVDVPIGKTGKTQKMMKLNVDTELDANSAGHQGKYNSLVATSKQRQAYNSNLNEATQQPKQVYRTTMSDLKNAGYSQDQINKGVQQGLFIIN
jgi:hypothetical protein